MRGLAFIVPDLRDEAPIQTIRSLSADHGELLLASWETILPRTMLMSSGRCSPAEYRRMVLEKADAFRQNVTAFSRSTGTPSAAKLIAPWHRRPVANAGRLRRK